MPETATVGAETGRVLLGRRDEQQAIDRLLERVRSGRGGVLVVRGEAGVGKTSLLEYLAERAAGCDVVRAAGVQADMELPFAGLQQLFAARLDSLERLPGPQRDALAVAFGLRSGRPPDRYLVGLAVLGLVAELAEPSPLVCVVDDAQWLDRASAQTLAFVARRLVGESVVIVFAVREPSDDQTFAGVPTLQLRGLSDEDARTLLASVIRGRLDERVVDRVVAETRGNPLALLELPHAHAARELAGGFAVSPDLPITTRLERSFLRRLDDLPAATQQLVLLAAAEPVGDPALLLRAAEQLGIGVAAAAPAELVGLIELGTRVRFRHPLVRSAVYGAATLADRQAAHRALAEATDPAADPDRRAWHRAQAALGPDEDLAVELESVGAGARRRAAGWRRPRPSCERAAALDARSRHASAPRVGRSPSESAGRLRRRRRWRSSTRAALGPLDEREQAMVEQLRGRIAVHLSRAARPRRPCSSTRADGSNRSSLDAARDTHLEALYAATVAGRFGRRHGGRGHGAARAVPAAAGQPRAADLLLDGLALRFSATSLRSRTDSRASDDRIPCRRRHAEDEHALAVARRRVPPQIGSTTRAGICSPPATRGSRARTVHSACFRSASSISPRCASSRGSSRPPRS